MARAPRLPQGGPSHRDPAGAEPADVRASIEQPDGDAPAEPCQTAVARPGVTPPEESSENQSMDAEPT